MKDLISIKRYSHQNRRKFLSTLALITLIFLLVGCEWDPLGLGNTNQPIDKVVNEIEKTRQTIDSISSEWRDELPKLVDTLEGLESQADADVKGILSDTTNQVRSLATQTIKLSAAKTNEILGNVNAFVLCDADFVKQGVRDQLQYLIDDLQFWKQNQRHLDKKPNHHVCVINPSTMALYPIDEGGTLWQIDTSNMSSPNIMQIFGYNFLPEALPILELQDANSQTMRNVNLTAAYVTHYQINLDFSNEDFSGVQDGGARVVLRWPDLDDPNTINLTLNLPAKLVISNPIFDPPLPTAQTHNVSFKVRITNEGGSLSEFTVTWQPDPNDQWVSSRRLSLQPQAFADVSFDSYQYKRGGTIPIESTVSFNTGDDSRKFSLIVAPPPTPTAPPPPTPVPIASAPCPVPIETVALPTPPLGTVLYLADHDVIQVDFEKNLPPDRMSIVLKTTGTGYSGVWWWKGLQLQDAGFNVLATVETQDNNHGPVPMTITLQPGDQRALVFWKAKEFGKHTKMHCVGDLTKLPGYTVTFTWLKD
jgi:hypothetical protein